jgi:hypothetical protein
MSHTRLGVVTLAVTMLAASGCGGSANSAKTLTRTVLIAKADVICKRLNVNRDSTPIRSQQDVARILSQHAIYERDELAELGKLVPPTSMANDWKRMLAGIQTLAEDTAKVGEYVKSNNRAAARPLISTAANAQQQVLTIAKHNGFKECARTSSRTF